MKKKSLAAPRTHLHHFARQRNPRPVHDPREAFIGTIRTHRQVGTVILLDSGRLLTTTHLICDLNKAQIQSTRLQDCYDPLDHIRLEFITPDNQLLVVGVKQVLFDGLKIIAKDGFSVTGWDIALLETIQDLRPILGAGLRVGGQPDLTSDALFISRPEIGVDDSYVRMVRHRKGTSWPAAAVWGDPQYQTFQSYGFSPNWPSFSGGAELNGNVVTSFKYQAGLQYHGSSVAEKIEWFGQGVYQSNLDQIDRDTLPTFLSHQPFIGKTEKQAPYFDALMIEATQRVQHEINNTIRLARDCQIKGIRIRAIQDELKHGPNPALESKKDELEQYRATSKEQLNLSRARLKTWLSYKPHGDLTSQDPDTAEAYIHSISPDLIIGAQSQFEKEATHQYSRAKSTKKPPILGNRQAIAGMGHTHLILDVGIWSWGVNQAFIEGISAKGNPVILHTDFPETAKIVLRKPKVSGSVFLTHIETQEKLNPTLWHSAQNRPTWYAIEIAGLLDLGYRLAMATMHLSKTQAAHQAQISKETSIKGIEAYLKAEGIS